MPRLQVTKLPALAWPHIFNLRWLITACKFYQSKDPQMNYILVTEYSTKKLQASVCEKMKQGYKPLGGPYGVQDKRAGSMTVYYQHTQAMVFEAEADAEKQMALEKVSHRAQWDAMAKALREQ